MGWRNRQFDALFEQVDSELKAYVLGFVTADAYIQPTRYELVIGLKLSDEEHVFNLARVFDYTGRIPLVVQGPPPGDSRYLQTEYKSRRLRIYSKRLIGDLAKLGVKGNKTQSAVPWNGPDELLRHYWRGVIDGDGSVNSFPASISLNGTWAMVSGFLQFCSVERIPVKGHGNVWATQISGAKAIKVMTELYHDAWIALPRKLAVAGRLLT